MSTNTAMLSSPPGNVACGNSNWASVNLCSRITGGAIGMAFTRKGCREKTNDARYTRTNQPTVGNELYSVTAPKHQIERTISNKIAPDPICEHGSARFERWKWDLSVAPACTKWQFISLCRRDTFTPCQFSCRGPVGRQQFVPQNPSTGAVTSSASAEVS